MKQYIIHAAVVLVLIWWVYMYTQQEAHYDPSIVRSESGYVVTFFDEDTQDDSIATVQYIWHVGKNEESTWTIQKEETARACREGRWHQDLNTELCQ